MPADRATKASSDQEGPSHDGASLVDRYVGSRIRERRILLGISQQELAALIGVSYQQTHKYELAINRISAGRLFQIARVLGISISWFFEGLEHADDNAARSPGRRMSLELVRNFMLIENPEHQTALSTMARVLAAG